MVMRLAYILPSFGKNGNTSERNNILSFNNTLNQDNLYGSYQKLIDEKPLAEHVFDPNLVLILKITSLSLLLADFGIVLDQFGLK